MDHASFVEGYRAGRLSAHIDESIALRIANSKMLPRRYQAAHLLWTWVWFLSFPAAIACFIWVRWWVGLIVLVIAFNLPKAIKRSASQFVLDRALEDEEFFKSVVEDGVLSVTEAA